MYSKKSLVVLMASLALAQAIAIGKPVNQLEGTTTRIVKANPNDGFSLQSGFEGFVSSPQKQSVGGTVNGFRWIAPTLAKLKLLKSMLIPLSGALLMYGAKILTVGLHLVFSMLLGIVGTSAVCSFTPICSFSLNLPGLEMLKGKSVREQVSEFANEYLNKENLELVSLMVQSALSQYGTSPAPEEEQPDGQENAAEY